MGSCRGPITGSPGARGGVHPVTSSGLTYKEEQAFTPMVSSNLQIQPQMRASRPWERMLSAFIAFIEGQYTHSQPGQGEDPHHKHTPPCFS